MTPSPAKAAILLPEDESYGPSSGSSLSRWVHEYLASRDPNLDIEVWTRPPAVEPPFSTLKVNNLLLRLYHRIEPLSLTKRIENRFPGLLYCLCWWPFFHKVSTIVLENRAHYALYLRRLGFRGRLVLHQHNRRWTGVEDTYLRKLEKSLDGIIGCSWAILKPLKARSTNLWSRCEVVYNAANDSLFSPSRGRKRANVVLYVGQMIEGKGLHLIVEAFAQLPDSLSHIELWVAARTNIGTPRQATDYESRLAQQIEHLGLSKRVRWLGFLQHERDLPRVLAEATVLCLASTAIEAFPLVLVEAMHSGTPTIGTNVGGVEEAIGDGTGLLVEPTSQSIAEALTQAFQDQTLWEHLRTAGLAKANQQYGWAKVSADFSRALQHVRTKP